MDDLWKKTISLSFEDKAAMPPSPSSSLSCDKTKNTPPSPSLLDHSSSASTLSPLSPQSQSRSQMMSSSLSPRRAANKPSKAAVESALAAAKAKRELAIAALQFPNTGGTNTNTNNSSTIISSTESRNDRPAYQSQLQLQSQQLQQSPLSPRTHGSQVYSASDDGLEVVALKLKEIASASVHEEEKKLEEVSPNNNNSNSSNNSSNNSSSNSNYNLRTSPMSSFDQRTEDIILEARMASSQANSGGGGSGSGSYVSSFTGDKKARGLIQQALDKAALKTKAASADAIHSGRNSATSGSSAAPSPLRSTKEVLELAIKNGILGSPGTTRQSSSRKNRGKNASSSDDDDDDDDDDPNNISNPPELHRCMSPTESVGSIDDYETAVGRLPSTLAESEKLPREKILQRIDGILALPAQSHFPAQPPVVGLRSTSPPIGRHGNDNDNGDGHGNGNGNDMRETSFTAPIMQAVSEQTIRQIHPTVVRSIVAKTPESMSDEGVFGGFGILDYFWGGKSSNNDNNHNNNNNNNHHNDHHNYNYHNQNHNHNAHIRGGYVQDIRREFDEGDDSMAPLSCGGGGSRRIANHLTGGGDDGDGDGELPAMATSLVRVMSDSYPPSYAETIRGHNVDPRMAEWIDNQFATQEDLPPDGTYQLGASRTVIVHEIQRGDWTWCTAWSPDGNRLAIGTENHHLAVVDTNSSSVWRVRHDKRISGPVKNGTTHSIRSIAWGSQFIAIGGTGNAVSILAPTEPYPILHTIPNTGFVGSLHWLTGTNTLAIGSRLGKAMVVKIWARDDQSATTRGPNRSIRDIQSTIVHTIDQQKTWVNAVKFSPGGMALAVGDGKGILGIYSYEEEPGCPIKLTNVANFKLEDSIMTIEWSPDGQWLYAGGEDFAVTVINTTWWEAVHRMKRDRWVQFISSSHGGNHVAVGGVSSEVSILEVDNGWDTAINVSLKGLLPLSAQWHPQDQYLVLTGQNNSVLAVETTNARHVSGHFLRSVSPILAIEFSPDGRMAAIGNEAGIVTIFKLSGTTFITNYELVLDCDGSISIQWSLNGAFLAIAAGNKLVIIAQTRPTAEPSNAPPNMSGFYVAKVVRDLGKVHTVAIDPTSRYVAVSGAKTRILDATSNFKKVKEFEIAGTTRANSWSPGASWLAIIGQNQNLIIYDTASERPSDWKAVFTVHITKTAGLALAWGPVVVAGLQYCAYGGEDKEICIVEIRTKERTWETVLNVPRDGIIHDLDWNNEGLVAAAIGNGTVTVMDLSYLQSGWAVNEMDYNWQRQALTCFTEIRRNRGKNCMRTVRWIPSAPGSDSLLAVGGTDGELEIVDLTERKRCSGYSKVASVV